MTLVSGALVIPIAMLAIVLAAKASLLHQEESSGENQEVQATGEETKG